MSCIITLLQVHNLRAPQEVLVLLQFIILLFNYFPLHSHCCLHSPNRSFLPLQTYSSVQEPFYLLCPQSITVHLLNGLFSCPATAGPNDRLRWWWYHFFKSPPPLTSKSNHACCRRRTTHLPRIISIHSKLGMGAQGEKEILQECILVSDRRPLWCTICVRNWRICPSARQGEDENRQTQLH